MLSLTVSPAGWACRMDNHSHNHHIHSRSHSRSHIHSHIRSHNRIQPSVRSLKYCPFTSHETEYLGQGETRPASTRAAPLQFETTMCDMRAFPFLRNVTNMHRRLEDACSCTASTATAAATAATAAATAAAVHWCSNCTAHAAGAYTSQISGAASMLLNVANLALALQPTYLGMLALVVVKLLFLQPAESSNEKFDTTYMKHTNYCSNRKTPYECCPRCFDAILRCINLILWPSVCHHGCCHPAKAKLKPPFHWVHVINEGIV